MSVEVWKDVPDYENYKVSNLGRIKNKHDKILNGWIQHGYKKHELLKNNKRKTFSTHQLVAMAFLGHNPKGMDVVVDHINNNKLDNRVENLQVVSNRENTSKDKKGFSSNYIGVAWDSWANKWKASIRIGKDSKLKHLGRFKNEYDAHLAYQKELVKFNENTKFNH